MAELTGMATESLIRMLKKFKDDHLIQMKGKTIKILDAEKLHTISLNG